MADSPSQISDSKCHIAIDRLAEPTVRDRRTPTQGGIENGEGEPLRLEPPTRRNREIELILSGTQLRFGLNA
jgi:hypothetical protein